MLFGLYKYGMLLAKEVPKMNESEKLKAVNFYQMLDTAIKTTVGTLDEL